jgi:hypothetical protein
MARGDFSALYVQTHGWFGEFEARGAQWMQDLGVNHVYVGHDYEGNMVRRTSEHVTGLDAAISEAYGGHSGYVVIDPLQRDAPIRVQESRAATPEEFGMPQEGYVPRDFTSEAPRRSSEPAERFHRSRMDVLRNPLSEQAELVFGGGRAAVPETPAGAGEGAAPAAPEVPSQGEVRPGAPVVAESSEMPGAAEFQQVLRALPERERGWVGEHFGTAPPDAMALENVLAIFGDRAATRADIFGDFGQVMMDESTGGNAGPGHVGVNGYYDPASGRIVAFGNVQHIPESILASSLQFRLRVNIFDGTISDVICWGREVPSALASLEGLRVTLGFMMPGREEAAVAMAQPRTAEAVPEAARPPQLEPVQLTFQEMNLAVVQLERSLPQRTSDRNALIRRLARDIYRYVDAEPSQVPEMYRGAVDAIRIQVQAGVDRNLLVVRFASRLVDTSGMVQPGSAAEMEATTGMMAHNRPLEAILPRGDDARALRSVARVLDQLDEAVRVRRISADMADPEYQAALRAIGEAAQLPAPERAAYVRQWAEYIIGLRRWGGEGGM